MALELIFFKSKIGALGLDRNTLESFVLQCSIMNIPFIYLGFSIGGNSTKATF